MEEQIYSNQTEFISIQLLTKGTVSRNWALSQYISRLSDRIFKLTENKNIHFTTRKVETNTRWLNGKGYNFFYDIDYENLKRLYEIYSDKLSSYESILYHDLLLSKKLSEHE